jgi:hypothetical protein
MKRKKKKENFSLGGAVVLEVAKRRRWRSAGNYWRSRF